MPVTQPIATRLRALLIAFAIAFVAIPALLIAIGPRPLPRSTRPKIARQVLPPEIIPPVEPVEFQSFSPDEARAWNAQVPFSTGPDPAARPFKLVGSDDDKARAIDCLAAGVLYEAGDDATGEKAVAQVVINRVRHPAFPKTICGVVFQGSERTTGCQFTFSCDGSLARIPNPEAWQRARAVATDALEGAVFRKVGYATHYHTDWVVPYWASSLDKITAVETHLFYRWAGWWGTPPAFNRRVLVGEPVVDKIAFLSDAHKTGTALEEAQAALAQASIAGSALAQPMATDPNTFLVALDPKLSAEGLATLATASCGDRPYCKFMGWTDHTKVPATLPLTPVTQAAMSFSYLRDKSHDYDKPLWNCAQFKRPVVAQCMKVPAPPPPAPRPTPVPTLFPVPLTNVASPVPAASPSPSATKAGPPKPGRQPLPQTN